MQAESRGGAGCWIPVEACHLPRKANGGGATPRVTRRGDRSRAGIAGLERRGGPQIERLALHARHLRPAGAVRQRYSADGAIASGQHPSAVIRPCCGLRRKRAYASQQRPTREGVKGQTRSPGRRRCRPPGFDRREPGALAHGLHEEFDARNVPEGKPGGQNVEGITKNAPERTRPNAAAREGAARWRGKRPHTRASGRPRSTLAWSRCASSGRDLAIAGAHTTPELKQVHTYAESGGAGGTAFRRMQKER